MRTYYMGRHEQPQIDPRHVTRSSDRPYEVLPDKPSVDELAFHHAYLTDNFGAYFALGGVNYAKSLQEAQKRKESAGLKIARSATSSEAELTTAGFEKVAA